jgi:error-prone DNA polymerase
MRLAVVAAGFTPGEADQLRRAMGGWRRPGLIEQFRQKLLTGMVQGGLSAEYAQRVFEQIRGFGEYGFPESHSASFALLVYVSAWLKHHYPAAFAAALLNSQPMGFYAPAQLVRDAREHHVDVRPIDVNHSRWDCTLEVANSVERQTTLRDGNSTEDDLESWAARAPSATKHDAGSDAAVVTSVTHSQNVDSHSSTVSLRLGLRLIKGLSTSQGEAIERARQAGPFCSLDDFSHRTRLGRPVIARLAKADAFSSLHLDRRGSLWQALAQKHEAVLPLFSCLDVSNSAEQETVLPRLPPYEEVLADYRTAGLSLKGHPLAFWRPQLDKLKVTRASDLATMREGGYLRVAGLVLVRQRPGTASGITFVTIEDETGVANLIVRPAIWDRYRTAAAMASALLVHGKLERQGLVIHILVNRLEDLVSITRTLRSQSRDFR